MSAQHSCATPEHGTREDIVALARAVIGPFDLDPSSSRAWNRVVGATRIITARQDFRRVAWVPGGPKPAHVVDLNQLAPAGHRYTALVNPPGDRRGELVAFAWRALAAYHAAGWISSAVWIGFSLEQLSRLQRVGATSHPLQHLTCIPSSRLDYSPALGEVGDQPTHASFITLLSSDPVERTRFRRLAGELGHVGGLS